MSRRSNTWSVRRWYADDRSLKRAHSSIPLSGPQDGGDTSNTVLLYRVYGPNGNTRLFTSWRNAFDWARLQASIDIWRDSDY